MKILYIGRKIEHPVSGADQVNKRNQMLLEDIARDEVFYLASDGNGLAAKFVFGITRRFLFQLNVELSTGGYTHVFISQSLLGRVARWIKRQYPAIRIVTFFHNIEVQYAEEYRKVQGLRSLPFQYAVKYWESKSVEYSDVLITLNTRDSSLLHEYYGKEAALTLPTSLEDRYDAQAQIDHAAKGAIDYLFVGVAFFANIQGAQWFIDEVMPHVDGELYIIGNGMDRVDFRNLTSRIHIRGYVDDLSSYYYRAKAVVSPILSGGGMKTKTAEALMFAKGIIGTPEAFEGYEIDPRCMVVCRSAEEFIAAINAGVERFGLENAYARDIYSRNHNTTNLKKHLERIL
ncbi:glycosyltransferase family 4 protein [uncultured Alistipes sp.]|uniref:glycosyltransferase family 4 protein n=2 Tax=uncultured Alistipes sp. TaxID=538949 RepID=UPI0026223BCC|nr:glycosyltransferase [uncultured Alistipes sp.]